MATTVPDMTTMPHTLANHNTLMGLPLVDMAAGGLLILITTVDPSFLMSNVQHVKELATWPRTVKC
jgi:hypothetical protein